MQEKQSRRTNDQRTQETKRALIAAARALFLAKGYAGTGTPEIVAAAGVTRGALYHHFEDKRALFLGVVESELAAVAAEVEQAETPGAEPFEALVEGGWGFFDAMAKEGRTRLLLIEAPAVLGAAELAELDRRHGGRTLVEGLNAAMKGGIIRTLPVEPLAAMLSAVFDRGALALQAGADAKEIRQVIRSILEGLRV
ncbi:MAG: TetR/AcrR family transcriptional regulator [Rhizobium sp.]|nr:TetR/AcrR family transcriptional regulator [Rhizobium sp.]